MGAGGHTLGANLGPGNQGPVQSRSEALGLQGRGGTQTCGQGEKRPVAPAEKRVLRAPAEKRVLREYWKASWDSKTAVPPIHGAEFPIAPCFGNPS